MSVNTFLTNLASELVLTTEEKESILKSILTLEVGLVLCFGSDIKESFQFGSSMRGTILPRKADMNSDIDLMVVFDTSKALLKPQTYLNKLRDFVKSKYKRSEIYQSSPTIVLELNHIKFELVPAIDNYGYQIPSPANDYSDWMSTDSDSHNKLIQYRNKEENYLIKPLIRLIKYWNAQQNYPYITFSLEKYILNKSYFLCSNQKDYFYHFWDNLSYNYDTAQYIKDKVDRAKRIVNKAREYEKANNTFSAELEIKKMVPEL
ncbi:MAG: nucleotidyltransferase [Candidatus Delongbacteria bacterium]|jgi:predicted nucleotidyltransferase|nr:nucleotidyltransferase [Candidatus Delongbacteria bacterium]